MKLLKNDDGWSFIRLTAYQVYVETEKTSNEHHIIFGRFVNRPYKKTMFILRRIWQQFRVNRNCPGTYFTNYLFYIIMSNFSSIIYRYFAEYKRLLNA